MAVVARQTRSSVVTGLVFKKIAKEEDPNLAGAPGVYVAYTQVALTPLATSTNGAEQTFTPAELADLDPSDFVSVIPPSHVNTVILNYARCSAAGTLAICWVAQAGTPTPPTGTYTVMVLRVY
jgi:hypothetical protein